MKTVLAVFRPAGRAAVASLIIGLVFGITIFVTGRAVAQTATPKNRKSIYAVLEEAPEKAIEKKNPFAGDAEAVAAGGKLFEQHCSECHGKKAGGTMHGANLLREEVQQATPGTLFWVLTNGVVRRGMPVWSKLPEPERWQIITFLQSLRPQSLPPSMKTGTADPGGN